MTRPTLSLAALALLLLLIPTTAQAQASFAVGPRLGIDAGDIEEFFIGADVRIDTPALPVVLNPTFDFYFTDDPLTFWSFAANALYPFAIENDTFTPYAGAGLGLYRSSVDVDTGFGSFGASSTDLGLNLIGGAQFGVQSVTSFIEAQYTPVFGNGGTLDLFTVKGGVLLDV